MGTDVDVVVPVGMENLVVDVRRLFEEWQAVLTRFSPESELSRLSARPEVDIPVSDLLFTVLQAAVHAAHETEGLFDPTLRDHLVALGYDRTFAEVKARDPWAAGDRGAAGTRPEVLPDPGGAWRGIALDPERRTARVPGGAGLDLGGIAKGMAVDAALGLLEQAGCRAAAVDAGGDLAVLGDADPETGWPVHIELPAGGRVLRVHDGALATSGTSRRHWRIGDRSVHHIIDPRTGSPAESGLWSATVSAPTCEAAEVAATAAFLLGPVEGARWLDDRGIDGLLVQPDGTQIEAGPWSHGAGSTVETAAGTLP